MDCRIQINGEDVGDNCPVYVIAEIGINHNGKLDVAKELIDRAKWAQADAVKLQTYITEKRVPADSPIFDLLKQCEFDFEQQRELFAYGNEKGIDIFSTPFDEECVDFLSSVDTPCYKVASFDVTHKTLLDKISRQGRPVIVSRGMASRQDLDNALGAFGEPGIPFAILHCVSAYPVKSLKDLNLRTIQALKDHCQCPVGFSDHTIGTEAARIAVAAGATIIEKHFTLSKKGDGPDHAISVEPEELKDLVAGIRLVQDAMGEAVWQATEVEKDILQYRRYS